MAKNKKNLWWRPEIITPEILTKLEMAFAYSLTDDEASLFCWISPRTLYRYIDKNPEFWHRKELLKKKPNIKAKMNWIEKMNNKDYQASKEWLERKSKDEFSMKTESDNNNKLTWELKIELPKE